MPTGSRSAAARSSAPWRLSLIHILLKPIFQFFPSAITGSIYSFGYTLLVGVLMNFVMGMGASRLMLKSVSKFKCFGSKWLYGGKKDEE